MTVSLEFELIIHWYRTCS